MNSLSTELLIALLVALIALSGFFSSSETSMMSLNRYRLRHLVNKKHRGAMRAASLLARTDRLIGVILIGNNFVNIFATVVAGIITVRLFGEWAAAAVMPIALTIVILIFSEVTPKSIAAVYPEKIAFPASVILRPLLWALYPVVWFVNAISYAISRIFGLDPTSASLTDALRPDELRTVVDESGEHLSDQHQGMLLNVLDLEKATVEDILVPRNEVFGIDICEDIGTIMNKIRSAEFTMLPVYEGDINNVIGVLHMRNIARFISGQDNNFSHKAVREQLTAPYFIPESTPLSKQLLNFQKKKRRMALVVDEYGDIQGLATLVDLLEEIVGDFSTHANEENVDEIIPLANGWHRIDGSTSIREINRELNWKLPTGGPKTLNGLIIESLENIPDAVVSFQIANYRFEVAELADTRIEKALVSEIS
ncbi:MAG: Mg2+/Co2+ transporter CorB [Flavobacteriales bacterium]